MYESGSECSNRILIPAKEKDDSQEEKRIEMVLNYRPFVLLPSSQQELL
jgi:hypothetical protein